MTIFGPDISSYQAGLNLSRLAQAAFVIAKTTEGTFYTDADFEGWRRQAASLGKTFIWYHFLSGEDARDQAAHTASAIPDHGDLPGMLDAEPTGSFSPTLAQMIAYVDAAHDAGLNLRLIYLPHWYWQQIGSPSLAPLADRGLSLVSSAYPGGSGFPAAVYPGDGAAGWQSYGGMVPLLYQFTNQASDGGRLLDYNAFRGTAAELESALHTTAPTGGTMALDSTDARTLWSYSHGDKPDVHQTLTNAANHAASTDQKLDQVLAHLAQAAPAPVDAAALAAALVNPLATALAPHISGGVDVDQIAQAAAEPVAHAVLAHMAEALRAG